jgi:hypothetical protein
MHGLVDQAANAATIGEGDQLSSHLIFPELTIIMRTFVNWQIIDTPWHTGFRVSFFLHLTDSSFQYGRHR